MTNETIGRRPVQIVELRQPICANTYGVSPCTASGGADAKCFNCRAGCQDPDNFRYLPEDPLEADRVYGQGDTLDYTDFTRTADLFFALKVSVPASPTGCLFEIGGSSTGIYLGFTSGNIVWRAGSGASGTPSGAAKVDVAATDIAGKLVTLYGEIDISANSVTLWFWDGRERTITQIGTDTAAGSFGLWAGTQDGAVGRVETNTATGEDATDFNGTIHEFKVYDSQAAPDMTADFVLPLYFSNGRIAEKGGQYGLPHVIPSLDGASTSPARISLGGSSVDAQGIGIRATCSLSFTDHPHTDRLVDPYLSGRTYDPMTRGSFWTKWLSRNRYRQNVILRLYEGYEGEALSSMVTRQYFLQSVSPPGDGGSVTIQGADVLVRAQARRSQLPSASFGKLYGDITATTTSIECDGAEVTDYSASGTLRIDDELMTYSAVATSANGITFTISERGTDGTTAATHDTETTVQECRRYTKQRVDAVLKDILTYGGVDEGYLDLAGWESEADEYLTAYLLTTVITEPTSVQDLVNELVEQCQIYIWWDERARKVKIKAVRGVNSEPDTITAESNVMTGIAFSEEPRERVTQIWFHYGLRDYTQSLTDPQNYDFRNVTADLPAETQEQYGEPSVKQVFSRWVRSATLADTSASKIVSRYRDTPRRIRFAMDAKDRSYWLGDQFRLSHYLDVDDYGERQTKRWTIIEAEETEPGHRVEYLAEDTTLYGQIYYIQASGAADFPGAGSAAFGAAYIGNSSGALSDGTDSARVN